MSEAIAERRPAYAAIADKVRQGITRGSLAPGMVLLEGALAQIFGSSRVPVKQALAMLEEEGLLRRFDGRGLIVGDAEPVRVKLVPEALGLGDSAQVLVKSFAWQSFYYDFEREITLRSILGRFKINELALARHYGVGRTVARDLLLRTQLTGLVEKGESGRWWIVPLDEKRFENLYELRLLLEPVALRTAVEAIPDDVLESFRARLIAADNRFPDVGQAELDQLENDLHVECLGFTSNTEVFEALRRSRCILIAGKHIQTALARTPKVDPFMDEHLEIFNAVSRKRPDEASALLFNHLISSSIKAQERLALFRNMPPPDMQSYISN
jgi:DNA-binding GntR family transcriptional regulator